MLQKWETITNGFHHVLLAKLSSIIPSRGAVANSAEQPTMLFHRLKNPHTPMIRSSSLQLSQQHPSSPALPGKDDNNDSKT